jgi:antitoxin (DNA-binding transcriptional repressor) of toxin-antitoxin stability system
MDRMYRIMLTYMRTINALAVRKELGAVLDSLAEGGEPVLVTRDREPVAALERAMAELVALQSAASGRDSLEELRALRDG